MKKPEMFLLRSAVLFLLANILVGPRVQAHPGGMDSRGCHFDTKRSEYHCHKGELKDMHFASKEEAQKFLNSIVKAPESSNRNSNQPAQDIQSPNLEVISWNVKHMGRKDLNIDVIASMIGEADIIIFQEVNKTQSGQFALTEIAKKLTAKGLGPICMGLSEPPSGAEERYAYLWKDQRISYVTTNGEVIEHCSDFATTIKLATQYQDQITREPAVGTFLFKISRSKFNLASIHLLPSGKGPQKEVEPLFETFRNSNGPFILGGDFNLDARHPIFQIARTLEFTPALIGEKTSLKMKRRELSQAYDNFWFKNLKLQSARVINLYEHLELPADVIYKNVSDHSPIAAVFSF